MVLAVAVGGGVRWPFLRDGRLDITYPMLGALATMAAISYLAVCLAGTRPRDASLAFAGAGLGCLVLWGASWGPFPFDPAVQLLLAPSAALAFVAAYAVRGLPPRLLPQ